VRRLPRAGQRPQGVTAEVAKLVAELMQVTLGALQALELGEPLEGSLSGEASRVARAEHGHRLRGSLYGDYAPRHGPSLARSSRPAHHHRRRVPVESADPLVAGTSELRGGFARGRLWPLHIFHKLTLGYGRWRLCERHETSVRPALPMTAFRIGEEHAA
jgi:hypothetical protein